MHSNYIEINIKSLIELKRFEDAIGLLESLEINLKFSFLWFRLGVILVELYNKKLL